MRRTGIALTGAALLMAPAQPCPAAGAPVAVSQNSARNISRVIQQRSAVVAIDRDRTVTQGSTTVTEIVEIGPDPAPLSVSQAGLVDRAVTFQQGREPRLRLRQSGAVDSATTVQREMP